MNPLTAEEKRGLINCLEEWLLSINNYNDCSDHFFRQVYSARVRGFLAMDYTEKLKAEAEQQEFLEKEKMEDEEA